jgi:hypothetical protein
MTRILLACVLCLSAVVPSLLAQSEQWPITARGDWSADTRQWWSDDGERRIQLNMRTDDDSNWGTGVRIAELDGLPAAASDGLATDVRFSWTREAGLFRFQGSFDRGRGNGTFTFSANPAYVAGMATLGYRNLTSGNVMRLAFLDVSQTYTRSLRDAGYPSLALDDLIRMRIHKASAEEIRALAALGYQGLAPDEVIKFRIHKVEPLFIRGLSERNYRGLLADDLVKMRIHKVSLQEIDELKTLGYGGLLSDELIKLRIHKVTPQFIRSIHDAGFKTISIEHLVKMRIHKVDAQFIKDLQADGYRNLSASDVIDLAIRGPRFSRVGRTPCERLVGRVGPVGRVVIPPILSAPIHQPYQPHQPSALPFSHE